MDNLSELIRNGEGESVEFKEQWNDHGLEALASFVNTKGGTLLVGVRDNGTVTGWNGDDRAQQVIINQIVETLRVQPEVSVERHQGKPVLVIRMKRGTTLATCRGRYFQRVGNTTREIPAEQLGRYFIAKLGVQWDSIADNYTFDQIDPEAVRRFLELAKNRLPFAREDESIDILLQKLELIRDGKITRGAILLFGKNPQASFTSALIHMGRFRDAITIIDDKLLKGNLFSQVDAAVQLFQQYMQVRYEFGEKPEKTEPLSAMQRTEIWDYPIKALREAVINALIHRDYFQTGAEIQIRVYDDHVVITNPGGLPEGMTVDELRREGHRSLPRNTLLAQVFYYGELLEKWGTGTSRMITLCQDHGIPEPVFSAHPDWFSVTFAKDFYTDEQLLAIGLSDRQVQAVRYVRDQGVITNKAYRELTGVIDRTALRDLNDLCTKGIFLKRDKKGRATEYVLVKKNPDNPDISPT
ncbi:MAG: transcriptional regulator [Methanomicrobiales archaeon HGW-Methanomicrobiales-3]|jgi:ATP-dependent DNA helicase RecG|nr:MAG: transcriptional regulator [Methanomicrobiales archaeon HGW-Methanomicrobiales-3]